MMLVVMDFQRAAADEGLKGRVIIRQRWQFDWHGSEASATRKSANRRTQIQDADPDFQKQNQNAPVLVERRMHLHDSDGK